MAFSYGIRIDIDLELDPLGEGSTPADIARLFDRANWRRMRIQRFVGSDGPERPTSPPALREVFAHLNA